MKGKSRRKELTKYLLPLLLLAAVLGLAVRPALAGDGGRPFETALSGAAEAPGPGDADGSGWAQITLNQGQGRVCFSLAVTGITPATAAHIHVAPAGVPGPVVVILAPPTSGFSSGCVDGVSPELIKAIRKNPENYYVNVHNAEFLAGALRGQLSK